MKLSIIVWILGLLGIGLIILGSAIEKKRLEWYEVAVIGIMIFILTQSN